MNGEDQELIEQLQRPSLPAAAGNFVGLGGLVLFGFVGFLAWRKFRR